MPKHIVPWIELVIGIWVLISPWVLGASGNALIKWSNVLVGAGFVVVAAWRLYPSENDHH